MKIWFFFLILKWTWKDWNIEIDTETEDGKILSGLNIKISMKVVDNANPKN